MADSTPSILEKFKSFWAPVAFIISAVTLVTRFIQLLLGDWGTVTSWVIAVLGVGALIVGLCIIAFSKRPSYFHSSISISRYPKTYKLARRLLGLVVILSLAIGWVLYQQDKALREKFVILVADFYHISEEDYAVNEIMNHQMNSMGEEYEDVKIVFLKQSITEQEGSDRARTLGARYRADIVLWGWYVVTGSDALVTINVENLTEIEYLSFSESESYNPQAPIAEIEDFTFQQRLSGEMVAFTLFMSGMINYELERYEEAVKRFNDATQLDSWPEKLIGQETIFFYIGVSNDFLGHYKQAIADYTKAIETDPLFLASYINRGIGYVRLGDYEQAIADFSKAIEINPLFATPYNNRGNVYRDLGEYEQAIADFSKAIELDPQVVFQYYNRGLVYKLLGEYDQAIADFSKAIEIDPQFTAPYISRGNVFASLGEYDQAFADYSRAIEINPLDASSYIYRGNVYSNLGEYDQAIADFSKAIEIDPQSADSYFNRGNAYTELGEYDQAIADYSIAIEINPLDAGPYNNRGIRYAELGEYDQAIADYSNAIEINPLNAYAYNNRGLAYKLLGEYEQAIADFSKAIEIDPQNASIYYNRGLVYKQLGDDKQAIADFRKAMELSDDLHLRQIAEEQLQALGVDPYDD